MGIMKKIYIIGAGGHAKVIADIVLKRKEFTIDRFKPDLYTKFNFALYGYEGFINCSSLATDDINLDELDFFHPASSNSVSDF